MKIFREELFGGILYDASTLRYKFVDGNDRYEADKIIFLKKASQRTDILSSPIRVYFEITQKCNLNCRHCFVSSSRSKPIGIPTKFIMELLKEMSEIGVIDIRFTGGEPTMRKDWFEIFSYAKELGFVVSMNTNGIYIEPSKTIDQIASLNLDQVTISIDGMKESHDYMRGRGNFEKTISSVIMLSKKNVPIRFNTVLTRLNVKEVPQLLDLANRYAKEINFFYMRLIGRAVKEQIIALDFLEHFNSSKETIELRSKYPKLNIMHFEQSFLERSIFPHEKTLYSSLSTALPYGSTVLNIASDGTFWPHGYNAYQQIPEFKLGQFPNEHVLEIWHSSPKLDAIRLWFRAIIDRCKSCFEYQNRCAGLNFEMEIAKSVGSISENPYCINQSPIPNIQDFIETLYN